MLTLCPQHRITAEQALSHPYFTVELPPPKPPHLLPGLPK